MSVVKTENKDPVLVSVNTVKIGEHIIEQRMHILFTFGTIFYMYQDTLYMYH